MIKSTAADFSSYLKTDMSKQLTPIEDSIDDMLTRLEEFESMVLLVQQERGNVVGLTGTLPQIFDRKNELNELCAKVNVIESLVINIRDSLDSLEEQIQTAEQQLGYVENSALKTFFIPKIFATKKTAETRSNCTRDSTEVTATIKLDQYFSPTTSEENSQ